MAEAEKISGPIFVVLMFIGAGVGLIFGRPDVGGAIGMGIGFLVMVLIKTKYKEIKPEKPLL